MTRPLKCVALVVVASIFFSNVAYGQTIFLARKALGAIKRHTSQSQGYDVATVLLEADADNVYRTAVGLLSENPKIRITSTDRNKRSIEFTSGDQVVSLTVSRIQADTAQLIVGSAITQGKESSVPIVIDGIFRICNKMGVACALSND